MSTRTQTDQRRTDERTPSRNRDRVAGAPYRADGMPEIADPLSVSTVDARTLSTSLFKRLATLEEGTAEYSYVRNTLVELNLSLVKFAARRFRSRSEPIEDIVQVGTIGLIKAINRFDAERGVEFTSFALPTIVGEIKRFFRDTSWAVQVPRRLQELRIDLAKARDAMEQHLGRCPTAAELAEHLGSPRPRWSRASRRRTVTSRAPWTRRSTRTTAAERGHPQPGQRGPGVRHRGVRGVPQAGDRLARGAGPADPVAALRRGTDAVRDRRPAGPLPDACLTAAGRICATLRAALLDDAHRPEPLGPGAARAYRGGHPPGAACAGVPTSSQTTLPSPSGRPAPAPRQPLQHDQAVPARLRGDLRGGRGLGGSGLASATSIRSRSPVW